MQHNIKTRKIVFFVNNRQASNKTVKSMVKLVTRHNVPVFNVTETLPRVLTT